jgi:hypothetical protein
MDNTRVTLHEDTASHLYLEVNTPGVLVYDVTEQAEPAGFESDAVAVLDGAAEAWPVPRLSREAAGLGQPTTPEIAVYDDEVGRVEVRRHPSGEPIAREAGRRYIGYLDTPSTGWGGARPGAGRKALQGDGGPLVRRTVTLPAATVEGLTALGGGNLSAGIRALWASHHAGGSDA